jgi:hypothetical protein
MTSIEWLRNELVNNENIRWRGTNINVLIEQAQAMHKQEIIDAANTLLYHSTGPGNTAAEQYYNKTFNK